jgi:outer membrane biosynthesis protein TonB
MMKKTLFSLLICVAFTFTTAFSQLPLTKQNASTNKSKTVVAKVKTTAKPKAKTATTKKLKPVKKPVTKPVVKPKPTPKPTPKPVEKGIEGDLKSIIEKLYIISQVKLPKTGNTELTAENSKYYIGTNNVEYTEALASEPLMGSFAHSVVLLRVKDSTSANIKKIKEEIKTKVDPRKWICVGVEPENVIVDNVGNLVILIVSNDSEKIHKAFIALSK